MSVYIIISGVDGSGKTTVIEGVRAQLESEGKSVGYIWMRYHHKLIRIMHAIAKLTGLSKKEMTVMGEMWLHYFYKSPLFCFFYLYCSYIDSWLARKKPTKLKTDYVICDRWVNDIIIDMGSETHKYNILDSKWYKLYQNLLPKNSIQFVVIRNRKDVLDCRAENTFNEAFYYRYKLYQKITQKPGIIKVDNNGSIENSISQVIKAIKDKEIVSNINI